MYNIKDTAVYTGNPASFTGKAGDTIGSLTAAITPVQAGSGDPSPTNVRPITGYTGANIYVSPTQNQGDATVYNVDWTSAAGTVYGGTLDALAGKLTVTHVGIDMGSVDYTMNTTHKFAAFFPTGTNAMVVFNDINEVAPIMCSSYKVGAYNNVWATTTDGICAYQVGTGDEKFGVVDHNYSDPTTFKTAVTGQKIVYPLKTPKTYNLTPQQVAALVGQNYIWSDLNSTVSVTVISDSAFHTLSVADAPETRCRIFFIGDGVDCTDDNDVQTNGTLLVGDVGDTDSNGRIGQDGITFTEFYNSDLNVEIGRAVSSQIEMTLMNKDGALDNFAYGRCKVYLDVYDPTNSTWIACPMGVYVIELPTKRKSQLIHATGFDQMQKLDVIADSWWDGMNWTGGLTMLQIVNSMATQIGFRVSANTASSILNSSVTYTSAPFSCSETTYREVLETIAEATCTVARFDRDGALDLKWFSAAQVGGSTVQINTDTVGNQCLGIDVAEYQVAAIDLLKVKIAEFDADVSVGSGTNQYAILDNLFLYGTDASITSRSTPIYNRLNGLGAYKPIQSRLIWDWSIEAGDIIEIVRDSTTYTVPIFQQTMKWRGGYVVSNVVNSGDQTHPVPSYNERYTYRTQTERLAYGYLKAPSSSGQWYRIMTISNIAYAAYPWAIDITIGRIYVTGYQSEVHKLTFFATYNKFAFMDEDGQSNYLAVDKIRYVKDGTTGYIDIHYIGTLQNTAYATFSINTVYFTKSYFMSDAFTPVADAPTADTIVTYDFEHYDKGLVLISSPNLAVGGNTAVPNLWRYKMLYAHCNTDVADPIATRCVVAIPKVFGGQMNIPICTQSSSSYLRVQVTDTALYYTDTGISGMQILNLYGVM